MDKFQVYSMTHLRLNYHITNKNFINQIYLQYIFTKFRWDDVWFDVFEGAKVGVYNYHCS